jgi:SAM-dependent methyltransferase
VPYGGGVEQRYDDVTESLRTSYDLGAERRDRIIKEPWKLAERQAFLDRLCAAGCVRLLEIGAGTGQDAAFFAANGLDVTATDLSPEMVARCAAKGLRAHVMDFLGLDFPAGAFDGVYAMNCLLHVPDADLPAVLATVARLLVPGGLFFVGVYGGRDEEGVWDGDSHTPPRFFSRRADARLQEFARRHFEVVDFHTTGAGQNRFQSLTLRSPSGPPVVRT